MVIRFNLISVVRTSSQNTRSENSNSVEFLFTPAPLATTKVGTSHNLWTALKFCVEPNVLDYLFECKGYRKLG